MSMDPGPSYPTTRPKQTVAYFYDGDVGNYSYGYGHPMKPHRMRMTHNLVVNYGLDRHMDILRPKRASREQMAAFHTDEYVDFLNRVSPETMNDLTGDGTRYLIGEDCPAFEGLWEFCTISAGGSLAAAERINSGQADVAINWAGGLHHAKKREASGFCYVNDIVMGILELLRTHLRVLYIDIDIHHGDGVEEAFYTTDRVLTVSFHKFGDFFPGTGDVRDIGMKKGKGYAVNVPLKDGVDEKEFGGIFRPVLQHIMDWYRPGAVVLQCGADSLAGDKLGCFNLSMKGHADCVRFMQSFDVPLICLGGGGYTIRNVAKTWTYETGLLVHKELDENLPFNEYIQYFGPEYKLDVPPTSMDNQNSREYIEGLKARIIDNLRSLPSAPSVQMQEVPHRSLNMASLELSDDEDSDLDERISRKLRDAHIERYGDELSGDEDDWDQDGSEMESGAGDLSRRGSATTAKRLLGGAGMSRGLSARSAAAYSNGGGLGPGIAGGRRGSAPWKNQFANHDLAGKFGSATGAASAMRPRLGPFDDNAHQNGFAGAGRHAHSDKPKRSFFAARAAGLTTAASKRGPFAASQAAPLSTTMYDDFDGPAANGHGTPAAPATGAPSAANSEAADSPVPSSAMRDSPMVS